MLGRPDNVLNHLARVFIHLEGHFKDAVSYKIESCHRSLEIFLANCRKFANGWVKNFFLWIFRILSDHPTSKMVQKTQSHWLLGCGQNCCVGESFSNSSVLATTCVPETGSSGGLKGICFFWAIRRNQKRGVTAMNFLSKMVMFQCGWVRNPAPVGRWFIPLFVRNSSLRAHFSWCFIHLQCLQWVSLIFGSHLQVCLFFKGFQPSKVAMVQDFFHPRYVQFSELCTQIFRVFSALLPPQLLQRPEPEPQGHSKRSFRRALVT